MTSRRSPPEKKVGAKPDQSAKGEENVGPGAMDRFKRIAKKVVNVSRDELAGEIAKEERRKRS
jgi:hypothetical protein